MCAILSGCKYSFSHSLSVESAPDSNVSLKSLSFISVLCCQWCSCGPYYTMYPPPSSQACCHILYMQHVLCFDHFKQCKKQCVHNGLHLILITHTRHCRHLVYLNYMCVLVDLQLLMLQLTMCHFMADFSMDLLFVGIGGGEGRGRMSCPCLFLCF